MVQNVIIKGLWKYSKFCAGKKKQQIYEIPHFCKLSRCKRKDVSASELYLKNNVDAHTHAHTHTHRLIIMLFNTQQLHFRSCFVISEFLVVY